VCGRLPGQNPSFRVMSELTVTRPQSPTGILLSSREGWTLPSEKGVSCVETPQAHELDIRD